MKNFVNYVLLCFLILWLARVHILLSCIYMLAEQLIWTIFAKFFLSLVSQFLHSATRVPFCFVKCVLVNSKKCNPHRRRQPTNQNLTNQLLKEKKTLRRSSVLLRNYFLRKWASGQKFQRIIKIATNSAVVKLLQICQIRALRSKISFAALPSTEAGQESRQRCRSYNKKCTPGKPAHGNHADRSESK